MDLAADEAVELLERDESAICVADVVELFATQAKDHELARRALATEALPAGWSGWIAERLESAAGE